MSKPKILVTSASGKTGIPTVLQLLALGYPVRAFVRQPDQRSRLLKDAGAELFIGNQYDVADMRRAMAGVQRAYHCAPGASNGLYFGTVFAVAANEAKLEHVVTLGQWLANPDHPSYATRQSWLNDELIKLLPETTLTVNNAGWFADNYFFVLGMAAQLGLMPMPLGDADLKGNAPPSNEDIAAVSVAALIDPASHAGKIYRPTGPALLSMNEIAAIWSQVLGRKVRYMNISEAMFLKSMKAFGFPSFYLTQLRYYADEYRRGTFAVHAPNTVLPDVVGRSAEDFETITRRYVAEHPDAVRRLGKQLKAVGDFMRILLTPTPQALSIEHQLEHVMLEQSEFSNDSQDWRASHDPVSGYLPDHPTRELQAT